MPGFPVLHYLLEFVQTHVHQAGDSIQPFHPLLSPSPPALTLSQHSGAFTISWLFTLGSQNIGASASPSVLPMISFRNHWFDLLAVQGNLKSLLQHHNSKASFLRCSAFCIVQLSHLHMTTGKIMALTRQTSIGKVKSLLYNMLSRLVITFLPRSKCLLISWLHSPSAVILEPKK